MSVPHTNQGGVILWFSRWVCNETLICMRDTLFKNRINKLALFVHDLLGHIFSRILGRRWMHLRPLLEWYIQSLSIYLDVYNEPFVTTEVPPLRHNNIVSESTFIRHLGYGKSIRPFWGFVVKSFRRHLMMR